MSLEFTPRVFIVHQELTVGDIIIREHWRSGEVEAADFSTSILSQMDEDYDLLILDWGLKAPDSHGVLDIFRQNTPETRILGVGDDIPSEDPVDRGADEFLVTPLSESELNSTIDRLLLQKAYEETMSEYFQLATEKSLLESERQSDIDVSHQYQSVTRRLKKSKDQAELIQSKISTDDFDWVLRKLLDD